MTLLLRTRERLFGRPLLLTPEYANVVVTALADRLNVEPLLAADVVDRYRRPNDRPVLDRRNGIAVYPIVGSMVHRGDGVSADSGVQSYTAMQRELSMLLDDSSVRAILLDIDSSGGEAAGLTELADWMMEARNEKPIWAIANTSACSGAYWLGASASRLFAAPMSSVGSIGVVTMHTDVSKAMDKKGIVTTFIYAGKHKIDGNPLGGLTDDVKARVQANIDDLYTQFVDAVADRRGIDEAAVRATEAGVFSPDKALELGLVDDIGTLGSVLKAFNDHLTRPHVPGATMDSSMKDTFTQADLDRARTEGHAEGVKVGADTARTDITAALTTLTGSDPRVSTFVEALNDGVAAATAVKFASKIEAPKAETPKTEVAPVKTRTEADVDRIMSATVANVGSEGNDVVDPKTARLAELTGSMKAYNASKGYAAARA